MAGEKKDLDGVSNHEVGLEIEGPGIMHRKPVVMPNLPKPLSLEEKKFLLAVERGDSANVRRFLQRAHRRHDININCVDSLGRGALNLAIDGENLEMVELLVIMGLETKDALLHAINAEFIEAVELLLEHEEIIHKEGEPHSWEKVDKTTTTFTSDITPLILAAHKNNYEILKILLDRGATLPMPHDIRCGCDVCIRDSNEDSLRHSISRVSEYRALASPALIALSSSDPILTAFQLSWELRNLAFTEQECKSEYMELRRQCQKFAVDLLDQSRSSQELAIILNHDPDNPSVEEDEHMKLTRLELAINYKQKKFVAHPNIQQLLAAIWYDGLPGFRRKPVLQKLANIVQVAVLFPLYCALYMVAPNTQTGKLMRKPFMKFLIHASSYLFFLFILILVSQRAEVLVVQLFGTDSMKRQLAEDLLRQRGNGPTMLECLVVLYVLGFIWQETMEIYVEGIKSYLRNMWNFIDFTRNMFYVMVFILRCAAYMQQRQEIAKDPATAYIPREQWDAFDPQLIAEGAFAAANIFSALKLVHLFSINPHLGPLQISLGRMVIDIVKFFFIYSLVLFAFACGLNQLLWYFAELERQKCYCLPGGLPDWENKADSCMKWRSFGNLFESTQSLFWASFGMVGIDTFELTGIKTYTRFWGLLMFGSYSVINVIVLLNLLIAMMSNSYAMIEEHADTEWKFARTKLWMSYFEESATLPPPFNVFPTPKLIFKLLGIRKKDKLRRLSLRRKEKAEKERDYRYTAVMRSLVWRYVSQMHRQADDNPVTEDDINEVKGEITAMRYELLEVLKKNGMDVSSADMSKENNLVLGKKNKIWERRLMKDFHLAPVAPEEEMESLLRDPPPENEDPLDKFRRIAKLAVLESSNHKWGQVVEGICRSSQIGRCNNRESFKNQQYLQKAMEEAKKLVSRSPAPGSPIPSPIPLPETTGSSIVELLNDISKETRDIRTPNNTTKKPPKRGGGMGGAFGAGGNGGGTSDLYLTVKEKVENANRSLSPNQNQPQQQQQQQQPQQYKKQTDLHKIKEEMITKTEETINREEESPLPLVQAKRCGVGESPPKIFKRKAPSSAPIGSNPVPTISATVCNNDLQQSSMQNKNQSVSTQYLKPTEDKQTSRNQDRSQPQQQIPKTIITPSTNPKNQPTITSSSTSTANRNQEKPVQQQTKHDEKSQQVLPKTDNSSGMKDIDEKNRQMMCSSSTERLIPDDSPEALRPAKRIEEVRTIKREQKAGWI
ncbi:transient-receptor-potential-like protein isoform X1 [Lycorma delicatula]|uniref:transient-receptor-potential-like protein isoform X1 n=1 Tax=Lycorma delicatula TaxID=130591 RepID=UPI003F50F728